ncbi:MULTISPECIES: methyltransferase domain-containing protein [Nocardioides]|uniref:Methyltransferase domain-containing protein n=1 Tax=Nocardioides vastitatis TaxID=2568655 RepID=A0ABW0ZFZ8_9ACTN|nr:methyltransferase domain-containing protein [Nocardioides sp.]
MSATMRTLDHPAERLTFDGLDIAWDRRVLRPRPWTSEQGRWAAELARSAPPGPILELCCGAGQIGIVAAKNSGRSLVQIDRDPVAAAYARRNAAAAGVESEVRCGPIRDMLEPGEEFGVVIADPPWLRTDQLAAFPEDPPGAVDGGLDGLAVVVACLEVGLAHLALRGHLLLQVGDTEQMATAVEYISRLAPRRTVSGVRDCRPGGVLMNIGPSAGATDEPDDEGPAPEGQVSEVSSLEGAGEPISPGDAVAGHPEDDDVQEGATGPDARTGNQDTDKDPQ